MTCVLDDSKVYASHAKKKTIDLDDVKLASQMLLDRSFTSPPPRDVLMDLTRIRNASPLPPLMKNNCGLRLPPDRHCLSACNYKLKSKKQESKTPALKKYTVVAQSSIIKRPPSISTVPKMQQVTIPKPVFKFSNAKPPMVVPKLDTVIKIDDELSVSKRKRDEDDFEIVN